jgi:4-amino-4-deoxy-L-arabinose transferase-like glycosyltransferase
LQSSSLAKRTPLLLFLIVSVLYLYGLGHLPLVGPDEPRYAQVAREMLLRNDFITPTLGGHLWFEKPALLYWLMLVSYKFFGVSEWSARLGPALSGLMTVVAIYWVGTRLDREKQDQQQLGVGFCSALVLSTSLGFIVFSKAASYDIVITMTTAWALCFFLLSELETAIKRRRLLLAGYYVAIGFSLLAKGLVGFVVPLGVASAYFIVRGRAPSRIVLTSLLWGIPLALVVAASWYGPMIWRHGTPFLNEFIIQHHFARYVSNTYHHPGPVYYYLVIIILLTLPWTAFAVEGLRRIRTRLWRGDDAVSRFRVFALVWIALPLIFFSFSSSKLPGYILPVLPAMALMAGEQMARFLGGEPRSTWPLRATGILCLLLAAAAIVYAAKSGELTGSTFLIAAPLAIAGTLALLPLRQRLLQVLSIAFAVIVVVVSALNYAAPRYAARESSKFLLEMAKAKGYGNTTIYGLQRDDRTPEFYAAGRITYGSDGEPVIYEGLEQIGNEVSRRKGAVLVFVPPQDADLFAAQKGVYTDVIGTNGSSALIAVRPR